MSNISIPAHFDGHMIVLDEPFELPRNAQLVVTVLSPSPDTDNEEAWLAAASISDAFVFLTDPREDIYSADDGVPYDNSI
jgi:hypothetical protein